MICLLLTHHLTCRRNRAFMGTFKRRTKNTHTWCCLHTSCFCKLAANCCSLPLTVGCPDKTAPPCHALWPPQLTCIRSWIRRWYRQTTSMEVAVVHVMHCKSSHSPHAESRCQPTNCRLWSDCGLNGLGAVGKPPGTDSGFTLVDRCGGFFPDSYDL